MAGSGGNGTRARPVADGIDVLEVAVLELAHRERPGDPGPALEEGVGLPDEVVVDVLARGVAEDVDDDAEDGEADHQPARVEAAEAAGAGRRPGPLLGSVGRRGVGEVPLLYSPPPRRSFLEAGRLLTTPGAGAPDRSLGASTRSVPAPSAVPALTILLLAALALRLIIAYVLLPKSGFESDLGTFTAWALRMVEVGAERLLRRARPVRLPAGLHVRALVHRQRWARSSAPPTAPGSSDDHGAAQDPAHPGRHRLWLRCSTS